MLKNHPSISMIEIAAEGIQSISGLDAVFVGGATTEFTVLYSGLLRFHIPM
jgi:hypothetical protein